MASRTTTVFIVDDAPEVRTALARLLSGAGYAVRSFESAERFLAEHDADAPGCLLLDYFMPGLSGLELQRELIQSRCSRAIVFLTGAGNIYVSVSAMKEGAVDFLTKPIDSVRLLEAVEQAIERDAQQRRMDAIRGRIQQRLDTLTPRERQVMTDVDSP
jgi:FixJ family two-component response regulator